MNKQIFVYFILSFIVLSHQQCSTKNGLASASICNEQSSDSSYCCFVDSPTKPTCQAFSFVDYEGFKSQVNEKFKELQITSIEQVHCGSVFERCINIAPDEGIDETCTNQTTILNTSCCYMKVKYDHGKTYGCYPVEKDKKKIKDVIKALKKEYIGSNSIKIDCSATFISLTVLSFISLLL